MPEGAQPQDFKNDASDQHDRWSIELKAAKEWIAKFQERGEKIDRRYRNEKGDTDGTRWGIFTSNTKTQLAMLVGQVPRVSVERRFADAQDDLARVGSEMLDRMLNTDIERDADTFCGALRNATSDYLLPGLGHIRLRYVAEFEEAANEDTEAGAEAPAGRKIREDVETVYVQWQDWMCNPCKVVDGMRWQAFAADLSKRELKKRFGKKGVNVPLSKRKDEKSGEEVEDPWGTARVWEIWSKEDKKVYWWAAGCKELLDIKDDPLGLDNFWPCPEPLRANWSTSSYLPRADYSLHEDQYDEADNLAQRIKLLEDAVRVAGVYNPAAGAALQGLLSGEAENKLIPAENWNLLSEAGGLKGVVDYLPLEAIVAAITVLQLRLDKVLEGLFQLTGMSDIMRGQAQTSGVTATEQSIKAKFGSVRIQERQDEIARFCSGIQRIRAEIICKHFDPQTILERCNCQHTPDAQLAPQAVAELKQNFSQYRIEVKPESVSMTDFAQLKAERMELMAGVGGFIQQLQPLAQQFGPSAMPFGLELLGWFLSGLKGSSGAESIIDRAVEAAKQAAANPQPQQQDPKMQTEQLKLQGQQMKSQAELVKIQAGTQAKLTEIAAETQAKKEQEQNQRVENVQEVLQRGLIQKRLNPSPANGAPNGRERP